MFSGWAGAYGKAVIIKHKGGKRSLYGHLSKTLVKVKKKARRPEIGRSAAPVTPPALFTLEVRSRARQQGRPPARTCVASDED